MGNNFWENVDAILEDVSVAKTIAKILIKSVTRLKVLTKTYIKGAYYTVF